MSDAGRMGGAEAAVQVFDTETEVEWKGRTVRHNRPASRARPLRPARSSGRSARDDDAPAVQFLQAFDAQARREEGLAHETNWFSTCPFSHPDAGVQATGWTR